MPKVTSDRIEFTPLDRQTVNEQSPGITASTYTTLFNAAITEGDTTKYFKFLEEIAEKDPDILQCINTRTSYVTSKEWQIEDEEGNVDDTSKKIETALREIPGDHFDGLLTLDSLIASLLGSSYLTGLSFSEIVTDKKQVIGFNHIPCHFLTFNNSVYYPDLWTQEEPTGRSFKRDKMISHYLSPATDPTRGYLGNAIAWQYVFRRETMANKERFQGKYGKGFLLINMPGAKDAFEKNWETAEDLIENYDSVDGAVFEGDVETEFKESIQSEGEYFFTANDDYRANITRIILGQQSTSSSEDSNRSTADVHMEVMEQRTIDDMLAIEDTLTSQLIPHITQLLKISEEKKYFFKFVVSEMEATLDEDLQEDGAVEDEQGTITTTEDDNNE